MSFPEALGREVAEFAAPHPCPSEKLIVEARGLPMAEALGYAKIAVEGGRISNDGKSYCYLTHFRLDGVQVAAIRNAKSDRLVVVKLPLEHLKSTTSPPDTEVQPELRIPGPCNPKARARNSQSKRPAGEIVLTDPRRILEEIEKANRDNL